MKRNALILIFTMITLMCAKFVHDYFVMRFDPYHIEQKIFEKVQESMFITYVDRVAHEADQILRRIRETEGNQVVQNVGPAMDTMRSRLGAELEDFTLMSMGLHKTVLVLQLQHESLPTKLLIFPSTDDVSDVRDVRWIWGHIGLQILACKEIHR